MKYLQILACSFLVTMSMNGVVSAQCTPTGTHLGDTFSGTCPSMSPWDYNNRPAATTIGKEGRWNISWPDGASLDLTATGSGQCRAEFLCSDSLFRNPAPKICWPAFHSPVATSLGRFSILVEDKIAVEDAGTCLDGFFKYVNINCVTSNQTSFFKARTCGSVASNDCPPLEPGERPTRLYCLSCPLAVACITPLLIDVAGNGFQMCGADAGVNFDIRAEGIAPKISWTAQSSDDAWLALDRNENGVIDDGTELFGNVTTQPEPPSGEGRNGFLALAVLDGSTAGGNNDGLITGADAAFSSLRLWQDRNHNGVSESDELMSLQTAGLTTLELSYKEAKKQDGYGNVFGYRSKVRGERDADVSRWLWDVFLVPASTP